MDRLAANASRVHRSVGINHWSTAGLGFKPLYLAQIELVFHDS